jgi:hypothetical protein
MSLMHPRRIDQPSVLLDAIGLSFLSVVLAGFGLWSTLCLQMMAQKPALHGVMTFHLSKSGDLRLWNQPILPQELPALLQKAHGRSMSERRVVVRLIPDPEVPWGVIHRMLTRLQPHPEDRNWVLQLQLP